MEERSRPYKNPADSQVGGTRLSARLVLSNEHLELHIKFEKGVGNKGTSADVKFYSAKIPSFYQISRQEQVLDILRNVTTTPSVLSHK